jgi:hypothetical protein
MSVIVTLKMVFLTKMDGYQKKQKMWHKKKKKRKKKTKMSVIIKVVYCSSLSDFGP